MYVIQETLFDEVSRILFVLESNKCLIHLEMHLSNFLDVVNEVFRATLYMLCLRTILKCLGSFLFHNPCCSSTSFRLQSIKLTGQQTTQ